MNITPLLDTIATHNPGAGAVGAWPSAKAWPSGIDAPAAGRAAGAGTTTAGRAAGAVVFVGCSGPHDR